MCLCADRLQWGTANVSGLSPSHARFWHILAHGPLAVKRSKRNLKESCNETYKRPVTSSIRDLKESWHKFSLSRARALSHIHTKVLSTMPPHTKCTRVLTFEDFWQRPATTTLASVQTRTMPRTMRRHKASRPLTPTIGRDPLWKTGSRLCVCVCVCVRARARMCVCVRALHTRVSISMRFSFSLSRSLARSRARARSLSFCVSGYLMYARRVLYSGTCSVGGKLFTKVKHKCVFQTHS